MACCVWGCGDSGGDDPRRDLGTDDGPGTDEDGDGGVAGACLPRSLARSPWNGFATGSSLRPRFRWAEVRTATRYELQVDDSCGADFHACAFATPEIDESMTDLDYTPASDLTVSVAAPVGRRYFWRVRSCDDATCDDWSEVRYLDVGRSGKDVNGDGYADAIVGARSKDNPESNEGNVFVYYGSAAGLGSSPGDTLDNPDNQDNAGFGYAVASADLDADGFADVIVGAPSQENGASNEGGAFVFMGSAAGLADAPDVTLDNPDNEELAFFGAAVADAGDLDGDGFADMVVGAYARQAEAGGAFLYMGSATGIAATPSRTLSHPDEVAGGNFGIAVASAGDSAGDGYADLAVGASGDDPLQPGGAVYAYCGSENGIAADPDETLRGTLPQPDDFGASLGSGDVDGDGYSDLVVGEPPQSRATLFLGAPTGLSSAINQVQPLSGTSRFGVALSVGDLDGDGLADVLVGADEDGALFQGAAVAYLGTAAGLTGAPITLPNPDNLANAHFGASVAVMGDADGDGDAEALVGAPSADAGQVFVYRGTPSGIATLPDLTLDEPDAQSGARFGYSVARASPPIAPDARRMRPTGLLACLAPPGSTGHSR